jgi:Mn2+/Fe2+ NRAMP family transporter
MRPSRKAQPTGKAAHPLESGPKWCQYLRAIGPGLITGASEDDPSGIATYAQAGSKYGLTFLWAALFTFHLMAAVQEISDRMLI